MPTDVQDFGPLKGKTHKYINHTPNTMMRFLYGKQNPSLLEAQDGKCFDCSLLSIRNCTDISFSTKTADSPRIQKSNSGEGQVVHLPDTVEAVLATGTTKDYPHVFIHEGDKRSRLCKKDYFIRVPSAAVPGNTFHVSINGEDYQVTCPEIERVGQKIVVTLERPEKFAHE